MEFKGGSKFYIFFSGLKKWDQTHWVYLLTIKGHLDELQKAENFIEGIFYSHISSFYIYIYLYGLYYIIFFFIIAGVAFVHADHGDTYLGLSNSFILV